MLTKKDYIIIIICLYKVKAFKNKTFYEKRIKNKNKEKRKRIMAEVMEKEYASNAKGNAALTTGKL